MRMLPDLPKRYYTRMEATNTLAYSAGIKSFITTAQDLFPGSLAELDLVEVDTNFFLALEKNV